MKLIVEADGGSRGNPGPAGYGAVVRDARTGEVLAEVAEAIGVATNNVAEYRALIAGLRAAAEAAPRATVEVRMDSKLVVEQMSGRWRIKHPDMLPLAREARQIAAAFDRVRYGWVPRERNKHADRLANEAMDAAARGRLWSRHAGSAEEAPGATGSVGEAGEAGEAGSVGEAGGAGSAPPARKAGSSNVRAYDDAEPEGDRRPEAGAGDAARGTKGGAARPVEPMAATEAGTQLALGADAAGAVRPGEPVRPVGPPQNSRTTETTATGPTEAPSLVPAQGGSRVQGPGWILSTSPPTVTLLLRHGETPLSVERRYAGIGDIPLTERGIAQARAAAAALGRRGDIDVIVTSPLKRTRQTTAEVAAVIGADVHEDEGFREMDFGEWEGLTFAEARARWPAESNAWLADPSIAPPGGESLAATLRRVREAKERVVERFRGRTILIVTHVTPIKLMVRMALLAPPEAMLRMQLEVACLSWVDWYDDGPAVLRTLNDTSHLA